MRNLTESERNQLEILAKKDDADIDTSDIPEIRELPPDFVVGRFYRSQSDCGD